MINVIEKFSNKAKDILENSEEDPLDLMLMKQYELMEHIVKKRNLYNYGIDNLMRNMVLSIFDELNEYIDVITDEKLDKKERETEALFELIDALHFIFQLYFLSYMKANDISLYDIDKVKDKILVDASETFWDLYLGEIKNFPRFNYENLMNLYSKMMIATSEVLNMLHWKHWKSYNIFKYYDLVDNLINLYELVIYNFLYVYRDDDYQYKIAEYYIIKNIENFDRQDRGY